MAFFRLGFDLLYFGFGEGEDALGGFREAVERVLRWRFARRLFRHADNLP